MLCNLCYTVRMTKSAKRASRSIEQPGQPKSNPSGMPYGTGSIQLRRRMWWAVYRDPEGRIIQENTGTEDVHEARRFLAAKAIITLEARLAVLREVAGEGHSTAGTGRPGKRITGRGATQAHARNRAQNPEGGKH